MGQRIIIETDKAILAFSKTVVGSGTLPHRIVMWDDGRQIIVHTQTLTVSVDGDTVTFAHYAYDTGDYFRYDGGAPRDAAILKGKARFHERSEAL